MTPFPYASLDAYRTDAPPCDDAETREEAERAAFIDWQDEQETAEEEAALTMADEDDDASHEDIDDEDLECGDDDTRAA